jgi:CHAT domain-containing protein/tetratricopeptide (TPR) repeat protein
MVVAGATIASATVAQEATPHPKTAAWRAVLAEPEPALPTNQRLAAHFRRQYEAAQALGDADASGRALRRLVEAEPLPRHWNSLGVFLSDRGEFDEAQTYLTRAAEAAAADQRGLILANVALNLRRQYRDDEAQQLLDNTLKDISSYSEPLIGWRACNLERSRAVVLLQLSRLAERRGRDDEALSRATEAVGAARRALARVPSGAADTDVRHVRNDLGNALRRVTLARVATGDLAAAERAWQEWQSAARAEELSPETVAQGLQAAARIDMARDQYTRAKAHLQEADRWLTDHGYPLQHLARIEIQEALIAVAWLYGDAESAWQTLERLDRAARDATAGGVSRPQTADAGTLSLMRGLLQLGRGESEAAATSFARHAAHMAASAGVRSARYFEAMALHGAALVRSADAGRKREGVQLLSQGTKGLAGLPPVERPDPTGLRERIRSLVLNAYLDSLGQDGADAPSQGIDVADWADNGPAQRALAEAAVRMAIVEPGMQDLVRREQDTRREVEALRAAAAGELERAPKALGDSAARLSSRMLALEETLGVLAEEVRVRYPDYGQLTLGRRVPVPELVSHLRRGEAVLHVYVRRADTLLWLVRWDGQVHSARVDLSAAQAAKLVQRIHASVTFNDAGRLPTFDIDAAQHLHAQLVASLSAAWVGVDELIVSTGGVLAAIPWTLLRARPTPTAGGATPAESSGPVGEARGWLIERFALSQAPGLRSWLRVRSLPAMGHRGEPLLGWGDPLFAPNRAAIAEPLAASAELRSGVRRLRNADARTASASEDFQLPSLPETRDELVAIAEALGADPKRSLQLGAQATRASVVQASAEGRLERASTVVFATHGLMAGDIPGLQQPALALASVLPAPGARTRPDALEAFLQLDDVLRLRLHADWVILSACNTAAADGRGELALSGLATGFFYAGARSLLVTHWAVETESAKLLSVSTLTQHTTQPGLGKAKSLRLAILKTMNEPRYAHPAFWAPYVVVGDGGP